MSGHLRALMESDNFLMPADKELLEDFESVERDVTETGIVRIAAPRSATGHADRFWAACLACRAAATHKPFELVMAL